jgi:hypothetical protein
MTIRPYPQIPNNVPSTRPLPDPLSTPKQYLRTIRSSGAN